MLQYFRWLGVTRVTIFTSSAREPEESKDRGARSKKKNSFDTTLSKNNAY